MMKNLLMWLVIAIILISIFSNFGSSTNKGVAVDYSQFLDMVDRGDVKQVVITDKTIRGLNRVNEPFTTYMPMDDPGLIGDLLDNHVQVQGKPPEQPSLLMQIFINWFPIILFIGVWIFFMRQMQGGGGGRGAMSFGKKSSALVR